MIDNLKQCIRSLRDSKVFLACLALLFFSLTAEEAFAQHPPLANIPNCITVGGGSAPANLYSDTSLGIQNGITTKFVQCVDSTIQGLSTRILQKLSDYMTPVVQAVSVFMIALQGIKILAGESNITASTFRTLMRLAVVNYFFYNMGGMATLPYYIMNELVVSVGAASPWGQIDYILGHLFGFDPSANLNDFSKNHASLLNGVLAMVGSSVFSGTPGIMIGLAGILAIFKIVTFALDAIYVYLMAIMVLALCIAVSPLIIGLAIFSYAESYFNKWLNVVVGAMIIPAFLFGFITFSYNLFSGQVANILTNMNPNASFDSNTGLPDFSSYARANQTSATWHQQQHQSFSKYISDVVKSGKNNQPVRNVPGSSSAIDSKAKNNTSVMSWQFWAINLAGNGQGNDVNMRLVMMQFIALWIYAFAFIGMVRKIPEVAAQIAGAGINLGMESKSLAERAAENIGNLKAGTGALIGGVAGKGVGQAITKSGTRRNASAEVGAMIGAMTATRL